MAASESNSKLGADLIAFLRIVRLARFAKFLRYALRYQRHVHEVCDQGQIETRRSKNRSHAAKISWDGHRADGDVWNGHYFKHEKKDSMCRIFDVLYFSLQTPNR